MTSSSRIKVFYVSPVGERGGAEVVLLNILKLHDRTAFDPTVCFLRPGPLVAEVERLGVRSVVVESGRIRDVPRTLRAIRRMRDVINAEQVDIVFSNMAAGHVFGGLAAAATRATAVWFQHGIPSAYDPLDWLAALIPSARIYVNSRATAAAQARLPRCADRLRLINLGVDTSIFTPALRPDRPLLSALGIPPGDPVIAMVARFQRWKGQDVLLRAAAQVVTECPEARFVLIGDTLLGLEPEYRQELHALVATLGLADHVVFAGFRDDVPQLLNEVDIVVHPHRQPEPFGLAVAEAMLMEKAVVASDTGGPAEIIENGETGILVPHDNVPALARSIVALVRNPSRRRALGRAARLSVLRRFTADGMVGELEASYRTLLH